MAQYKRSEISIPLKILFIRYAMNKLHGISPVCVHLISVRVRASQYKPYKNNRRNFFGENENLVDILLR